MSNGINILREYADYMPEGLIFIDKEGKIQIYNKKAKEIFGVIYNNVIRHKSGSIAKGDIVIIADSSLGEDDGDLTGEDLKVLGITNNNLKQGYAIIVVGTYNEEKAMPVYKYTRKKDSGQLSIVTDILGKKIAARINFDKKEISISVDKEVFSIKYIKAFGHMVIIDGRTGELKFYQSKGYNIRKESIKDILTGRSFKGKEDGFEAGDIIGRNIFESHEFALNAKDFFDAARDGAIGYIDKYVEINGIPTICALIPTAIGRKRTGALLHVQDISQIKKLIMERNEILSKLEDIEKGLEIYSEDSDVFPQIIGVSPQIKNIKNLLSKASKSNSSVLLLGESGTGKSKMAREIHNASMNRDKPFIHVNCASIPETLMESEFFGYEGGSFTGARSKGKIGYFEMANGGTLFLDEIGEIPVSMQVKLLQAIETKSFYRIGGTQKIKVDIRIISATNRNLEREITEGRFREDLYYRINVFPIYIPPLRDRKEDIYYLVKDMLPKICRKVGCETMSISADALEKITSYSWPGNVRELENVLERAVNLCERGMILSEHINFNIKMCEEHIASGIKTLREEMEDAEKKAILRALNYFNGDKKEAMKALDIRKTNLYQKLKKYGIDIP
jgi:transcriptional regulator with PAS, ATPase and Fis domain